MKAKTIIPIALLLAVYCTASFAQEKTSGLSNGNSTNNNSLINAVGTEKPQNSTSPAQVQRERRSVHVLSTSNTPSGSSAQKTSNTNSYFRGNLSDNPYKPKSISNPYGRYGSKYSPDSICNPFGAGNPYGSYSASNPYASEGPKLYDSEGNYRGNVSCNPYDPDSISNPYGRYGNRYSPDSILNPYGAGSPYRSDSPNNPFSTGRTTIGK